MATIHNYVIAELKTLSKNPDYSDAFEQAFDIIINALNEKTGQSYTANTPLSIVTAIGTLNSIISRIIPVIARMLKLPVPPNMKHVKESIIEINEYNIAIKYLRGNRLLSAIDRPGEKWYNLAINRNSLIILNALGMRKRYNKSFAECVDIENSKIDIDRLNFRRDHAWFDMFIYMVEHAVEYDGSIRFVVVDESNISIPEDELCALLNVINKEL